jgi:transposase-like protein
MARKSQHSQATIKRLVQRASRGESVQALAKEFKISRAGAYLWIRKVREAAMHAATKSPAPRAKEQLITVKALLEENARLKRRLFELLLKHGEL